MAATRSEDEIDKGERAGRQRQRYPIGDDVTRRRRAHVKQGFDPFDTGNGRCDGRRERRSGAAAERLHLREDETIDLGHHPGADREISAVQPKDDERGWQREQCGHNARDAD